MPDPSPRRLPQHLAALDGLRAVAVTAVIAFHLTSNGKPLLSSGSLGVNLFFVLSGFLITTILVGGITDHGLRYGTFLTRRALRLVPALVAMVAVVVVVMTLTDAPSSADSARALPFVLTYTSNLSMLTITPRMGLFAHTWSLALEEQFYLLWPLALALLLRKCTRRTALAVVLAAAIFFAGVRAAVALTGRTGVSLQADTLLVGCLAALVFCWATPETLARLPRGGVLGAGWVAVGLAAALVPHDSTALLTVGYPTFAVLVALTLIHLAARPGGRFATIALAGRPVAYLGLISYGVYLWHLPVMVLLSDAGVTGPASYIAVPAVTLPVAALSYHLLERRFLQIKERLAESTRAPVSQNENA